MSTTKIEWADRVWNPVTGCTKVSEGCRNCYAERIAHRFWGERKFSDVQCHEDRLEDPLHWKKPSKVFVNSMSDLFHPDVPDAFIHKVFQAIYDNPRHNFLILTKRPERMILRVPVFPIDNAWLGVSAENQETYDQRVEILLQTPAAKRFVSMEPLLGNTHTRFHLSYRENGEINYWGDGIHWVIVGGESGPKARPMHPDWVRSIRDNCHEAGIPFFFKQWGEWWPGEIGRLYDVDTNNTTGWTDGQSSYRIGRKEAGRLLDGVEWNEYPTEDK
jgi:protein gp37